LNTRQGNSIVLALKRLEQPYIGLYRPTNIVFDTGQKDVKETELNISDYGGLSNG